MSKNYQKKILVQKIGELYSGPGGIGLGAAQSSSYVNGSKMITEPVWINDICADSCQTWKENVLRYEKENKNFKGDVKIYNKDVRKLDIDKLDEINGLIFGFPCNDFSRIGKHKGIKGKFGGLYSYGVDVLSKQKKPEWFIAENVKGITSSNDGIAFKRIIKELSECGYKLTIHNYKFEEYGVPQSRHRVIIVGFRNDLGIEYKIPAPSFEFVSAREALANVPKNALNHELVVQHPRVVERLKYIKPGQNAWNSDLPEHLRLKPTKTTLSNIYRRLLPDQPAYTVTGSGGGGTYMYHWSENRALTNREKARLQTFPDWFHFSGYKNSVRKQIGMSIPVAAGKIIVTSVLDSLTGKPYPSIRANNINNFTL